MKAKHRKMWATAWFIVKDRRREAKRLAEATAKMRDARCPHAGRKCIGEDCVHFQPGKLKYWVGFNWPRVYHTERPFCKLWGPNR